MGSNQRGDSASVAVEVSALSTDPFTSLPVVLLRDPRGGATVPVSIGLAEASTLAAEIDGIELARPPAHHLMAAMLEACGARVVRVVITGVEGSLFSAVVHLELGCGSMAIQDARPSDAIALALRTHATIEVARAVVDHLASLDIAASLETYADTDDEVLAVLGDDAFGKWKM